MTAVEELIGRSPEITAVREKIGPLLQRHARGRRTPPILIQGETGTGKGLLARALHRGSARCDGPFVDVNCAAIPDTLLEAEMFGFERGAFTDARQAKPGLFQVAHGGTIFLDEIALVPEAIQSKLLKVIEDRTVRRLGSTRSEPVDAWIIVASNEDLVAATHARRFREDLYHRLSVITLWLPPLRERGEDVLLLAEHFLGRACADYDLPAKRLAPECREPLLAYAWPGNVRELANVMERVALLSAVPVIMPAILGLLQPEAAAAASGRPTPLKHELEDVERERLAEALRQADWNISRAAARLGMARNTLRYRAEKYGLRPDARRTRARAASEPAAGTPTIAPPTTPAAVLSPAPAPVRWAPRRLTLLRATVVMPDAADSPRHASRLVETLVEKAQSFGGRVEEISPRGLMAVFGFEPLEEAPRRATLTAMAMQKAAERTRDADAPLGLKMAIHLGQFLVGETDGRLEIDFDAKRQAWMVLETLLHDAEAPRIVVSEAIADPDTGCLKPRFQEDWGNQLDFEPVTLVPVWWPHEADSLVTEEDLTEEERVSNFGWHLEVAYRMFAGPATKPSPTDQEQRATATEMRPQHVIEALLWLREIVVHE